MLFVGRPGVVKQRRRAFGLAQQGVRLGCHHCEGVMATCCFRCSKHASHAKRSLNLARASAGKGSKYGQWALGELYRKGKGGVAKDAALALEQYGLAAAQGNDMAHTSLGLMYHKGRGVARDYAQALFWFRLAAAQWSGVAMYNVGMYYETGRCVAADRAEAIAWYRRAIKAGFEIPADKLKLLGA